MYLLIDTTGDERMTVGLVTMCGQLTRRRSVMSRLAHAEKLLPLIERFLIQTHTTRRQLRGVIAVTGPGGFTSLRIGILVANALAYGLDIPTAGFNKDEFEDYVMLARQGAKRLQKLKKCCLVLPYYGREPHITQAKPIHIS